MMDVWFEGARTVSGQRIDIGVADGRIAVLRGATMDSYEARETIDVSGLTVLPGVIDPHGHLNWPLYADPSEVMKQETIAGAAGGVTTIGHFPLGVTGDLVEHFSETVDLITSLASVDVAISYPILNRAQLAQIDELYSRGVVSYKMLRAYRPPDVYQFGGVDDALLYRLMLQVARMRRAGKAAIVRIHCENVELFKVYKEDLQSEHPDLGRDQPLTDITWADCRPPIVEAESVNSALFLAKATECPIAIVHLSSGMSLDAIRRARAEGTEVYVETTPLYLETDAYHTGAPNGPYWTRVQPSVKWEADSAALWEAVRDGTIDMIGTDHCATRKEVYEGKSVWDDGASGRSLLGIALPLMLDAAAKGKLSLGRITQVMSENPAKVLGIADRKGKIQVGFDADLAFCDLSTERPVTVEALHSRADHSPFEGRLLTGWPVLTVVRGSVVWSSGQLVSAGTGQYVPGTVVHGVSIG